jgi:selenoprotein W-related protein
LKDFEPIVEHVRLIPSDEGRFEVSVDGTLLYSKLATARHAEPGEILGLFRKKYGSS